MALLTVPVLRPWVVLHRRWLALLPWLLAGATSALGQSAALQEYQVKAAFLFNFAQFVDWPAPALPLPGAPLVIGILGEDPFGNTLDEIVRGEQVHDRTLQIQRYRRVEEIGECHVLFISRSESGRLEQILASLRGRSILTVGDMENFARRGGMVRLITEKNKVRIRISRDVAEAAGLKISSKLLRASEVISGGRD